MSLVNSLGSIEAFPVAYRAMAGIGQCVAKIDGSIFPFQVSRELVVSLGIIASSYALEGYIRLDYKSSYF
jgi:hypothetical protein